MGLNLEALRTNNAPLAEVIDALILGQTYRDAADPIAEDIAHMLQGRISGTTMQQKLAAYEQVTGVGQRTKAIIKDILDDYES